MSSSAYDVANFTQANSHNAFDTFGFHFLSHFSHGYQLEGVSVASHEEAKVTKRQLNFI